MLKITINSFSYKKNGYPIDKTENNGGYVFDCRGIYNPGRIERYKKLTGENIEVQNFLNENTELVKFLDSCIAILDITIKNYLSRDFENLQISFGCTGGQHRSVYSSIYLYKYLENKYKDINLELNHLNKSNWNI